MNQAIREQAKSPEDLARFFVSRANDGDVEGLVALYEPDAVLAIGNNQLAIGTQAIRSFYEKLIADRPKFAPGIQAPALRNGRVALTSSRLTNGDVTAEIANQQSDGSWLWTVDQPNIGK